MIALYKNLGPRGLIRIGGNVSDHARFVPDGDARRPDRARGHRHQPGEPDRPAATSPARPGWRVMWGLNLGTGTREEAVEEAAAVDQALGD